MTIYQGELGLAVLFGTPGKYLSADIQPLPTPVLASQGISGIQNHHPLFYYPGKVIQGELRETPIRNKVIISPLSIDVGLVVQDTPVSGFIWNTTDTNINVNNYTLDSIDGVVLTPTPPFTVGAYNDVATTINIFVDGSPIIDGYLVYETSAGNYRTYIQGLRGLIFSFPPGFPYREGEQFRTSIFKAHTGKEVRKNLLTKSKFRWEYVIKVNGRDMQRLQRFIRYAVRPTVLHPVWSSLSHLTANTDGTTTIYLDTADRDFQVGDYILLKGQSYEDAVKVTGVGTGSLTLEKPPRYQFYAGDLVVPLKPATLKEVQTLEYRNTNSGEFKILAEEM